MNDYYVGMAVCGEGIEIGGAFYFKRENNYPIRVELYVDNDVIWGYGCEVPWIGY